VSFLIQPHDCPASLATADLGTIYIIRAQQTESGAWTEQASSSDSKEGCTTAPQGGEETAAPNSVRAKNAHTDSKPHRDWSSLPLSEQAGIRCNDPRFIEFMRTTRPGDCLTSGSKIVGALYRACNISSRKEFDTDPKKAAGWRALDSQYEAWLTTQAHGELIR
jgi:hypothetical protein